MKRSEIYGRTRDGTPILKPVTKRGNITLAQARKLIRQYFATKAKASEK